MASAPTATPASLGYRMPAEWSPHAGTWLSWPHNRETWPGKFRTVEPVMVQVVHALAASEPLRINVLDANHEEHVRDLIGEVGGVVHFHRIRTNDAWTRDHGATFVVRESADAPLAAIDFGYNAWGGKYPPFDLDRDVARQMAETLAVPRFEAGFILEGGAIDTNGEGIVLTTASCVLNPNRNPTFDAPIAERHLADLLGAHTVLWVAGHLAGDDTDGHIDNLARFVSPTDIVMVVPSDPDDPDHRDLEQAFARLTAHVAALDEPITVHRLPLPGPVRFRGRRLPASHANFYIGNRVVLLPAYGGPSDEIAGKLLQGFFPDRTIVPIDCTDLVWGLGAFHCLTQQIPAIP